MSSTDPTGPLTKVTRHSRQNYVLARLINKASSADSPLRVSTLEAWLRQADSAQRLAIDHDSRLPILISDGKLHNEFQEIATLLYKMRRRLPTHPNFQRWTADPEVRTKLDTVSRQCPSNAYLHPATLHPINDHLRRYRQLFVSCFEIDQVFQFLRMLESSLSISRPSSKKSRIGLKAVTQSCKSKRKKLGMA